MVRLDVNLVIWGHDFHLSGGSSRPALVCFVMFMSRTCSCFYTFTYQLMCARTASSIA